MQPDGFHLDLPAMYRAMRSVTQPPLLLSPLLHLHRLNLQLPLSNDEVRAIEAACPAVKNYSLRDLC